MQYFFSFSFSLCLIVSMWSIDLWLHSILPVTTTVVLRLATVNPPGARIRQYCKQYWAAACASGLILVREIDASHEVKSRAFQRILNYNGGYLPKVLTLLKCLNMTCMVQETLPEKQGVISLTDEFNQIMSSAVIFFIDFVSFECHTWCTELLALVSSAGRSVYNSCLSCILLRVCVNIQIW